MLPPKLCFVSGDFSVAPHWFAFRLSFWKYSKSAPWNLSWPAFVTATIWPPVVEPYWAS